MAILSESTYIEQYKVQCVIKSNVYTETYRIVDCNDNPFFLKLFLVNKMPSKLINSISGIVKEVEYSKGISHPNIISCISNGFIEVDGIRYQYYITNYSNGYVLSDYLHQKGLLNEKLAINIFEQLMNGLKYLHTHSPALCHNDLDISNIMISDIKEDTAKIIIIDLGHLSPRCTGVVEFDTSDLNPIYHANETMVNIFDEQGDVFSVCAILYTLLTGTPPWNVELNCEENIDYKLKFKDLHLFRKSNSINYSTINASERIITILKKGLALKNTNRFEDIQSIQSLLNSINISKNESNNSSNAKINEEGNRNSTKYEDPNFVEFEIKKGSGNGFKDIAGMEQLKEDLYKQVIFVLKDTELAKEYRLTPPNGLLLYGPPGCGKTYFSEKFAEETGFNYLLVKASDVGSSYLHGSQDKINKLFKFAKENAPIVLCFDEFDALVPDRSTFGLQNQAGEVNEFLSQMNNCSQRGIFIVATSNRPDKIDPAVLRTGRIDKNVYVPLPDQIARKEMFILYLNNRPIHNDIDYDELANKTEGYIASDIAFIVNDAAMTAAYTRKKISHELLLSSINNIKPSLRQESLEYYEHIHKKMEDNNRVNNARIVINGLI